MKLWRWFVGQVARLRRSVVGVLGSGSQPHHGEDRLAADELAPGPPAHWVERVRRGAPGLLEPSLRRRGASVEPPSAKRVARSQTELDLEPEALKAPRHDYLQTESTVAPQPEAPVGARRLRQLLRRTASRSAPARAAVSPETDTNHAPPKVETGTRRVSEPPEPPPAEPDRRRFIAENRRMSAPRPLAEESEHAQGPPVPDKPERSQGPSVPGKTVRFQAPPVPDKQERASEPERFPEHSEVVSFEAPVQRRAARLERPASPGPPPETDITRPTAKSVRRAERAVDESKTHLFFQQADPWPSPAPIRGAERLPQRLVSPRPSPPEPSVAPDSPTRRRAEPLSEAGVHPWPELPPPLDRPDSDVEAALRAWEHQRRLDLEQTRL